jgi:hypothetical protein
MVYDYMNSIAWQLSVRSAAACVGGLDLILRADKPSAAVALTREHSSSPLGLRVGGARPANGGLTPSAKAGLAPTTYVLTRFEQNQPGPLTWRPPV